MRILLFTVGFTSESRLKNAFRNVLPSATRALKEPALLLPSSIQAALLAGYGRERRLPTGLGYLAAMLRGRGHDVELVDRLVDADAWPVDINGFDFVGVHTTTPCFEDALQVLQRLHVEDYRGPVAFGGPHTTILPETVPDRVDYLVQGEAEHIICDLVEGRFPRNSLIVTPRVTKLDELPAPDYSIFFDRPRSYELTVPFFAGDRVFNITTARSCPFQCNFCATKTIWGRLWTTHSPARVVEDIARLVSDYRIDGVYFREDLFTADKRRVHEICRLLKESRLELPWAIETRAADVCDVELVRAMAEAGCRGFYIGAESGSQRMLDAYVKEATVEQTGLALRVAKRFGIKTAMSIIVGDPDERFADKVATFRMVRETAPEILQTSVFNGGHTGLGRTDFATYDLRPRELVKIGGYGTWSGQRDRRVPVVEV